MLWDALFSTSIEIKAIGLAARDTLRLEKGFCLYFLIKTKLFFEQIVYPDQAVSIYH